MPAVLFDVSFEFAADSVALIICGKADDDELIMIVAPPFLWRRTIGLLPNWLSFELASSCLNRPPPKSSKS